MNRASKDRASNRASLGSLVVVLFLSASCGGSSGGGGGELLTGTVRSPGGISIGFTAAGSAHVAPAPGGGRPALDLDGLLTVPDGTPVQLVRVDANGAVLETLGTTSTAAGVYRFELSGLGVELASDLVLLAGSGASVLRAPAVLHDLDVDPLSEALMQLVLDPGPLTNFTQEELADLVGTIELVARLEDIAADPDLVTTIEDWKGRALADPGFSDILAATQFPGAAGVGPGDVGDYFPAHVGNVWGLSGTLVPDVGPSTDYRKARRITDDTGGVLTIADEETLEPGEVEHDRFDETTRAFRFVGNDDPSDPLNLVAPYELARFPLRAGTTWEPFDVRGLSLGIDLDFDQLDEAVDLASEATLSAFEDVTVEAGTFEDCARIDTHVVITVHLTSSPQVRILVDQSDWYAPGIGPVRSTESQRLTGASGAGAEDSAEELVSYQVGTTGHGILPASTIALGLAQADSNQERPGRPGLASDGTDHLVVTWRQGDVNDTLVGVLVGPSGLVLEEFDIAPLGTDASSVDPCAIFDGTNYLVVFQDDAEIQGVRVAPDGEVLDDPAFPISTGGDSNFMPAVAFDGTNALVVWRQFDNALQGEIVGARVTPGASVLGEFPILSAAGDQLRPDVVFDGTNHFVAWSDAVDGLVHAARVAPDETVLDAGGFVLASGAATQVEPRVTSSGTQNFVVWSESSTANGPDDLRAVRVSPGGLLIDDEAIAVASTNAENVHPDVVFDGSDFLVLWEVESFLDGGVRAARVSLSGELVDGTPLSGGIVVATPPTSALLSYPALLRGSDRVLAAWAVNREISGETKELDATLVYPF